MTARTPIICPACGAHLALNDPTLLKFKCNKCGTVSAKPRPPTYDEEPSKSAVAAGLLQLFLGWFGLGRFYLGYTSLGVIQLALGVTGLILTFMCYIGLVILVPLSIWLLVDGIMMIAGAVPDVHGRKLR